MKLSKLHTIAQVIFGHHHTARRARFHDQPTGSLVQLHPSLVSYAGWSVTPKVRVGDAIRVARKRNALSEKELAEKLEVT